MLKRALAFFIMMSALIGMVGCGGRPDMGQASKALSGPASSGPVETGDPSDASSTVPSSEASGGAPAQSEEQKYDVYIQELGFLLNGPDWDTADDIPPTHYNMWYGMRVRDLDLPETEEQKYKIWKDDRTYFPAEEYEKQITDHFNVSVEHLRSYLADGSEKLYPLHTACMDLAESTREITNVSKKRSKTYIEFLFNINDTKSIKLLTVEEKPNGFNFISYVSLWNNKIHDRHLITKFQSGTSNKIPSSDAMRSLPARSEEGSYDACVQQLGYFLNGPDWKTVDDIPPSYFSMWYTCHIRDQHLDDQQYMQKYRVENRSSWFFPVAEYEKGVTGFFNVSVERLRSDPAVYLEAEQVYTPPITITDLAESTFKVTKATEIGTQTQINFELTVGEYAKMKLLTVEQTPNGFRFVSYVTK